MLKQEIPISGVRVFDGGLCFALGLRPSFPATPVVPEGRAFFNKVLEVRLRTQNFEPSGLGILERVRCVLGIWGASRPQNSSLFRKIFHI